MGERELPVDVNVKVFPGHGFGANVYALRYDDRCLLVDTGFGNDVGGIIEWLRKEEPEHLSVFLTHRHCDHIGGLGVLKRFFPEVEVFVHRDDRDAVANMDRTTLCDSFGLTGGPFSGVMGVSEGHVFSVGSEDFVVLHTPGHTAGSAVLFSESSGILFAGDLVFAGGGVGRWDLPTGDARALFFSLKKVSALPVKKIYPGHGPIVENGAAETLRLAVEEMRYFVGGSLWE